MKDKRDIPSGMSLVFLFLALALNLTQDAVHDPVGGGSAEAVAGADALFA